MKRICFFGDYRSDAPRVAVLRKGLEKLGAEIREVQTKPGLMSYLSLWKRMSEIRGQYDVVVVPDGTAKFLPLLAAMMTELPVVWLPVCSDYDIAKHDVAIRSSRLTTLRAWLREWLLISASDLVVLPTRTAAEFFAAQFEMSPQKFGWAFLGADDEYVFEKKSEYSDSGTFKIEYYGDLLHADGLETLIQAARYLMEDSSIVITLVGNGRNAKHIRETIAKSGVTNVTHLPYLSVDEITERIATAGVVVGVFGKVPYANRYFPERIFAAAAASRPVVSAFTQALDEVFDREQMIVVDSEDAVKLAEAFKALKADPALCKRLGGAMNERYSAIGTPESVARRFLECLEAIAP